MDPELRQSVIPDGDPFELFEQWYAEAHAAECHADAVALATASPDGRPSVRMVLLKGHGPDGFVFYTNAQSRKGAELLANPQVALLFHWKSLARQIRIEGTVHEVDAATADDYFHSRARDSQLGAVASDQSEPLDARETFIARVEEAEARFGEGEVPRPPHWTGFRLVPRAIEFWLDRPYRLHERRYFERQGDGRWSDTLLYP
jgi:pyridoxamine 5'-phosphate oxidase